MSCLLIWLLTMSTSVPAVLALESGNVIDSTGIRGTPTWGDNTVIDTDHQAIINWNNFDTSSTQSVTFNQYKNGALSEQSAVLNRINSGAVPTQFDGALNANGRVFIVNPAGIAFGAGSQINVTQLVASGLNMSDADFINATGDTPTDFVFEGGNGEVTSRAKIYADSVYFIGKKVTNISGIQAGSGGLVAMAAGDNVYLAQDGSSVLVEVSGAGDGLPDVQNRSVISVPDGKIVLAAGDTLSHAILNVGILAASSGEVTMQAAKIENNGRITVNSSSGDGGSINLTGTESVSIGVDGQGVAGYIEANAGANGDGGSVNIQTDGLFKIGEDSTITASGGSTSGNGGTVTINCDDFEILGDISASPGNKIEEPGKLEINTPSDVLIADGANLGATNTLYEDDIETLSQGATSLIVNTEGDIDVENITDDIGNGEITGQFGSIELHATGDDSAVVFADNTDTIRTTLGDIIIEAGNGGEDKDFFGINVGNLTTGKDLTDEKPAPGQISLTTTNGGNITTGDLTVRDGWGYTEIDIDSSGDLTVNGDVKVGSESSPILNVADQRPAEAMIRLNADSDVTLNGNVEAHAYGSEDDTSKTKAYIDIFAGNNANIKGDLLAKATSSSSGTADAVIKVEAVGDITFAEGAEAHAIANLTEVQGTVSDEEPEEPGPDDDHAQIIINANAIPPLIGNPDEFSTPKNKVLPIDVLANDTQDDQPVEGGTIKSYTDPTAGSLTEIKDGEENIVSFEYNPPEDLSTLTFDENGETTVTFTYVAEVDGVSSGETTVTITLINNLPVAVKDSVKTFKDKAVNINVLKNDTDLDSGDVLTAIQGSVTPKNGTLVPNKDGTFTYTPNEGFLGDDSFSYSITDGFNISAEVNVTIKVSKEPPAPSVPVYIPPAPGLDSIGAIEVEISGSSALAKWVAEELGVDERVMDLWMANSLASTTSIQPYNTYSSLRKAALVLKDTGGTHIAALVKVINEFASSTAPPTEEQMAAIADAIARNTDEDSHYAVANEYLDALVTYVSILTSEMGFSTTEAVQLVTDKYISRLTQDQNVGVAAFLAASLAALGG